MIKSKAQGKTETGTNFILVISVVLKNVVLALLYLSLVSRFDAFFFSENIMIMGLAHGAGIVAMVSIIRDTVPKELKYWVGAVSFFATVLILVILGFI